MILDDEVNPVNRLYRELSSRYKAGWTFHRFLQGLRKFFGNRGLEDLTNEFQSLYRSLREVSLRLNEIDSQPAEQELDRLKDELDGLIEKLDEQDRSLAPSLVRLFFQRVKTHDERILIDLIRFYLEAQRDRTWESERVDKVDFLLSRLGETLGEPGPPGDRHRLSRVLQGLATYAAFEEELDPQKIADRIQLIQGVRGEADRVTSFEELTDLALVEQYRGIKHGLGPMMFEKSILTLVVETNLLFSRRISEFTERAEEQIFSEYEKVSELEEQGMLTRDLADEVASLHHQVGTFRKAIRDGNVRLGELVGIRDLVSGIVRKVEPDPASGILPLELEPLHPGVAQEESMEEAIVGRHFEELMSTLSANSITNEPSGLMTHRLLSYQLEPRETLAFERLTDGTHCDHELERFLLSAAALRRKIRAEVEVLQDYGAAPGSAVPGEDSSVDRTLSVADLYVRRFSHFFEAKALEADSSDVRQLQILRMRHLREYSGLWLLAHRASRDYS